MKRIATLPSWTRVAPCAATRAGVGQDARTRIAILASLFVTLAGCKSTAPIQTARAESRLGKLPACTATTNLGELCRVRVADLRPTQFGIGFASVEKKQEPLEKAVSDATRLDTLLEAAPVSIAIGPAGTFYIIGDHTFARALWNAKVSDASGSVTANFADLAPAEFWSLLEQKKWYYPFDESGKGPLPESALPATLGALNDDPVQSVADAVREAGGYTLSEEPGATARWLDFFRTHLPAGLAASDLKEATKQGLALARSQDARPLPGFKGD